MGETVLSFDKHLERGRSSLQYLGMVILAALIVTGLASSGLPERVGPAFHQAVCKILGEKCQVSVPDPKPIEEMTRLERATRGSAVTIGDSYISGEGAGDYLPGTNSKKRFWERNKKKNECHRSKNAYTELVVGQLRAEGYLTGKHHFNACSGAIVSDIYENNHSGNYGEGPQGRTVVATPGSKLPFDKIPEDASLITISMGGNDIGFADILTNCVTKGIGGSGCKDDEAVRQKITEVYGGPNGDPPGSLEAELKTIREQHPDAEITLMGYPSLFAEKDKWWKTGLSVDEQKWANKKVAELNSRAKAMAERLNIEFVDPTSAFVGPGYDHRIGSDEPWINGLGAPPECFHPNKLGHQAIAGLYLQHLKEE